MIQKILLVASLFLVTNAYAQQKYSDHYYTLKAKFEQTPDTDHEIIFLGNSITEGANWKELFPKINAVNRGISGDVTDGILNRLSEVTSSQPKKIFLLIGTNDLARGKTRDEVIFITRKILEKIKKDSPETKIYLQSILPVNPLVGEKFSGHKSKQEDIVLVNIRLKQMAKDLHLRYINLHKCFSDNKGHLKSAYTYDGLHLSEEGYSHWAKIIRKYVR
tara:strand:- start:31984 stop:32640 length:657 start_codon:yes stop_codon:yes gene_type:complete